MAARQEASTGEIVEDGQTPLKNGKPLLHVKVYSPYRTYFNQAVSSLSGINATGPFDILPHHHNFITLLKPCELVLAGDGDDVRIKISGGIMQVHADTVTVFLDV